MFIFWINKALIDANIFPKLIEVLATGGKRTKREAVSVVLNLTQDGTPEQIRYLVELNIIPTLCELLDPADSENVYIVEEALQSLANTLKFILENGNSNPYAFAMKECGGLDKIEGLKSHQNENISQKAASIVETFFVTEKDTNSIPQVNFVFT